MKRPKLIPIILILLAFIAAFVLLIFHDKIFGVSLRKRFVKTYDSAWEHIMEGKYAVAKEELDSIELGKETPEDYMFYSIFLTRDFIEMCEYYEAGDYENAELMTVIGVMNDYIFNSNEKGSKAGSGEKEPHARLTKKQRAFVDAYFEKVHKTFKEKGLSL